MYPTVPMTAPVGPPGDRHGLRRLSSVSIRTRCRETEIHDLDDAVTRDHDVFGFQIPMNDAGRMGPRQSIGDLGGNRSNLRKETAPA